MSRSPTWLTKVVINTILDKIHKNIIVLIISCRKYCLHSKLSYATVVVIIPTGRTQPKLVLGNFIIFIK